MYIKHQIKKVKQTSNTNSFDLFKSYGIISKVGYVPFSDDKVNQDRAFRFIPFKNQKKIK